MSLLSIFEDPVGLERPLCRDYSRYQMYVNYDVAVANGVLLVAARAGISWGYIDPFFNYHWTQAEGKVYRTSYHVLYPSQDVIKQADQVWYKAQPERDVIPRVIDLEVSNDQSWQKISNQTRIMSELVLKRDGVRPIIYSRYGLINDWLGDWSAEELNSHYWWLAQYRLIRSIEHAGPPTLPRGVNRNRVIVHQTADKKAPFPGECPTTGAARSVDWDRWEIGNEQQMHIFIGQTWGEGSTPPPPPPPSNERHVRVISGALNIREAPSSTARDVGTLKLGTDVIVVEQQGDWLKLHEGWIHRDYVVDI